MFSNLLTATLLLPTFCAPVLLREYIIVYYEITPCFPRSLKTDNAWPTQATYRTAAISVRGALDLPSAPTPSGRPRYL
jgi:hypothetical protein